MVNPLEHSHRKIANRLPAIVSPVPVLMPNNTAPSPNNTAPSPNNTAPSPKKIRLIHELCEGDCVALTGCIESFAALFGKEYQFDVKTNHPEIFDHNPHITKLGNDVRNIEMHYAVSDSDKRPLHFMSAFCEHLSKELGINLPCIVKKPYIYLTEEEKSWVSAVQQHADYNGKFWLIGAGHWKNDYTIKKYRGRYLQEVINYFRGRIQFVQVGKNDYPHHILDGVLDFTGKFDNDLRGFLRLVEKSTGVISLESFLHHAAAAFEKPAITLCSGAWPIGWIHYPTAKILSFQSSMSCCKDVGACWRNRIVKLNDSSPNDNSLCLLPVLGEDPVARCMDLITPELIINAIESFYFGGLLTY